MPCGRNAPLERCGTQVVKGAARRPAVISRSGSPHGKSSIKLVGCGMARRQLGKKNRAPTPS
jgi:hypothetical protein